MLFNQNEMIDEKTFLLCTEKETLRNETQIQTEQVLSITTINQRLFQSMLISLSAL